jgi:hypothetical protein
LLERKKKEKTIEDGRRKPESVKRRISIFKPRPSLVESFLLLLNLHTALTVFSHGGVIAKNKFRAQG